MDYSKEFRDLIACTKDTEDFIGYGNPNAKILIIGKEESFDIKKGENNIIYNQASKGNWKGWEEVIGNPSITPDSIPVWKDSGKFCPLYPWKGDDLPKGTWTNYQKLINDAIDNIEVISEEIEKIILSLYVGKLSVIDDSLCLALEPGDGLRLHKLDLGIDSEL